MKWGLEESIHGSNHLLVNKHREKPRMIYSLKAILLFPSGGNFPLCSLLPRLKSTMLSWPLLSSHCRSASPFRKPRDKASPHSLLLYFLFYILVSAREQNPDKKEQEELYIWQNTHTTKSWFQISHKWLTHPSLPPRGPDSCLTHSGMFCLP